MAMSILTLCRSCCQRGVGSYWSTPGCGLEIPVTDRQRARAVREARGIRVGCRGRLSYCAFL